MQTITYSSSPTVEAEGATGRKQGLSEEDKRVNTMWIQSRTAGIMSGFVFSQISHWKSYIKYALVVASVLIIPLATSANASVVINSPSSGATVSGTVTVKAQITSAWWSKLWIDGNGGSTAPTGIVTFTWNSTSVADGSHTLSVKSYLSGSSTANSSQTITVVVNNHGSGGGSKYFSTLSPGASLPSDATCASEIPWEPEMVSANSGTNATKPTSSQLSSYRSHGYGADVFNGSWAYSRVDGQYSGTTDMIFRWAACKWGIDEDLVRAVATTEVWRWNQPQSGGDERTSYSQCVNGGFTSLWDYQCTNCCYQSWSIFQTKAVYNWQTWPMLVDSTAFAADYHFASMRACLDGDISPYFSGRPGHNGHTYSGDVASGNINTMLWGCVGFHYSGDWYDGTSSSGAIWYINYVKAALSQKSWKTRWPFVKWPD